jgi:ankyrin repeat protein
MSVTTTTTSKPTVTSVKHVVKLKPVNVLRKILSSDTGSSDSSSAAQTGASSPQTKSFTPQLKTLTFQKPSEEDVTAYDLETVKAIRANNLDQLRQLWCNGKSMNACNQFGESVLHMACRRGYDKIVEFLLLEVKVRTDRCDDFGRNPFHDALWTSVPNFNVVDLLIDYADPALLLSEDVRGNTPFAYARSDHSEQWIKFLEERREKLIKRIKGDNGAVVADEKIQVVA